MSLEISTSAQHEVATKIVLGGSLDSETAPSLEAKLDPILSGGVTRLVFDMSALEFISSAGLRIVFKAQKQVESRGGEVAMVNLRPQVEKVFEIVKALPSWSIFQNDQELDDYLQAIQSRTAGQR